MSRAWLIAGANSGFGRVITALADEVHPLGIKVLIVEPGALRAAPFGNISASAQIGAYAATVGPTRHMIEAGDGTQPGDPAMAAAAISQRWTPTRPRCACRSETMPSSVTSTASARRSPLGRSSPATPAWRTEPLHMPCCTPASSKRRTPRQTGWAQNLRSGCLPRDGACGPMCAISSGYLKPSLCTPHLTRTSAAWTCS